jgi:hypothetical protein
LLKLPQYISSPALLITLLCTIIPLTHPPSQLATSSHIWLQSDSELCSKLQSVPEDELEADPLTLQEVQSYKEAVERLHNDGETLDTLATYKASVEKLLGLNVQLGVN